MATRNLYIILDLQKKYILNTGYQFVQGDFNTNILTIQLFDNLTPVDLTNKALTITLKRLDNIIFTGCPTIIDALNGKMQYIIGVDEINYPGKVLCSIEIYDDSTRITTPQFCFSVRQELNNGEGSPIIITNGVANPTGYFGCSDLEAGAVEIVQQYKPVDWIGAFRINKFIFVPLDGNVTVKINNKYNLMLFIQEEFKIDKSSQPIETFEIVNTDIRYYYRGEY